MFTYQSKSANKRQRENDHSSFPCPKKHRAAKVADEQLVQSTTKIIDLNDDCLYKIFGYLNRGNLFNVAISNEYLRPAARYVYIRKFAAKDVEITECDDFHPDEHTNATAPEDWGRFVNIRGLKTCLQYLRCFGSSIASLKINYNMSMSKRYEYVHHYINKYCTESLVRISFSNARHFSMKGFEKMSTNVTDIKFFDCHLGENLPLLSKSFMRLRHLEFCPARLDNGFRPASFRHLEHLCIREYHQNDDVEVKNAANLLRSNHQLRSLKIDVHGQVTSMSTILDLIKNNSSIIKLAVDFCSVIDPVTVSEIERMVEEHPSLVELDLRDFRFTAEDAIALIDQLKVLQTFHFQVGNSTVYTNLKSKLDNNKYTLTKLYDWYPCTIELNCKN